MRLTQFPTRGFESRHTSVNYMLRSSLMSAFREYTCKGECGTLRPSFFLTQKLPASILKNDLKTQVVQSAETIP